MKKLICLIMLVAFVISCKGNENKPADSLAVKTSKQDQQRLKRYQVESGIIKYDTKISGNVMGSTITGSGSEVKYFKNWGAIELNEQKSTTNTHVVVMGKEINETTSDHQMSKLDNGTSYIVDFKNKKISEQKDMAMEMIKKLHPKSDAGEVGKAMFEGMGGKKLGEESFLGYNCEVWDLMGIKQWIYRGVTLKSEGKMMGITTITTASKVSFDVTIPDSKLKLPNYPIMKTENFLDNGDIDFDMGDMEELDSDMEKVSKLSFEEWKKLALSDKDDEEMQNMSEKELRQTYDMIQKMVKMRKGN